MCQILVGVAYCHQRRLLHRDLKPQNILIDQCNNRIKIADFGLARTFDIPLRPYTHEVVSLWYRAPEILLGLHQYGTSVDVWSIGCIFVEMMTGKALFQSKSEIEGILKIFYLMGTPNDQDWPGVSDLPDYSPSFPKWQPSRFENYIPSANELEIGLVTCLLVLNPSERATARRALNHQYFEK